MNDKELIQKLKEQKPTTDKRSGDRNPNVGAYDPVLRAHCRLDPR